MELQSYEMAALGKRMRYYEAMLDMDALMKGEPYDKLKDSYILFICKNDPFKDKNEKPFGLPRYSFSNHSPKSDLLPVARGSGHVNISTSKTAQSAV